jgi:histidyl-tRNA synthetase
MLPDAEILVVAVEVLSALKIGDFTIKVRGAFVSVQLLFV